MSPPDYEFLVTAVRHSLEPGLMAPGRLADSAERVTEWSPLLEQAALHQLMPHVACAAPLLPDPVREQVTAWDKHWTRTSMALSAELLRLTALLEKSGVAVLPLKGPALAQYLYGDPARRSFTDLDLFVQPARRDAALALLGEQGYHPRWPPAAAARHRRFDWYNEVPLRHAGRGIDVDLHWAMTPRHFPEHMDEPRLWHRAGWLEFGGGRVRAPHPEDYLEYLCLHGARHNWAALGWVADVAALVAREGTGFGAPRCAAAWEGCDRAHRTFGVNPPVPGAQPPLPGWRRRFAYRCAVLLIPTEADWAGPLDLPPAADFLYYPWRLARLTAKALQPTRSRSRL